MKHIMLLLLLTLSIYSIPSYLEDEICKELALDDTHCGDGSEIEYYKHFLMDDDKILLFLYLNSHSLPDREFKDTFPKVAVVIDKNGKWHLSKINYYKWKYYISDISEDFKNQLWARASMGMESPSPLLLYSKNGQKWYDINLPREKNRALYEYNIKKLCFQQDHLVLSMSNWDSKIKFWRTAYSSITNKQPSWKLLSASPKNCIQTPKIKNRWSVEMKKDVVHFKYNRVEFTTPITDSKGAKVYTIQLGAFKEEESCNIVEKNFDKLFGFYPLYRNKGKDYLRLLSGLYSKEKKAKTVLQELKKKYPKNRTLQDAFIVVVYVDSYDKL